MEWKEAVLVTIVFVIVLFQVIGIKETKASIKKREKEKNIIDM